MKYPTASLRSLFFFVGAGLALAGCGHFGSRSRAVADGSDQVALELDGREVTVAELDDFMMKQFIAEFRRQPADRQFEMREGAVRDLVERHVVDREAKQLGLSTEGLREKIRTEVAPVTVEDVTEFFKQNEGQLGGAPLEQIAPRIESFLKEQRQQKAWNDFLQPKLAALDWAMRLEPPRQNVEASKLVRGPAGAPVTLITFSDYQCPYCIRSEKVLSQLIAKYPTHVRIVHRHFPLDQIHPFARPAAEAAMCADEQGKFWPFHDAIFAREGDFEAETFGQIGDELGLDRKALEACIAEGRFKDFVEADVQAGNAAGVSGTPAFFVNGIPMKGARDVEDLSRVIDAELARLAKPDAPKATAR